MSKEDRAQRLAEQLRANLARRKAQQRGRSAAQPPAPQKPKEEAGEQDDLQSEVEIARNKDGDK